MLPNLALSVSVPRAGYVSFLFFRSKAWWVPLAKQLLRCALWVVGVTQRLPLVRVCEAAQTRTCDCRVTQQHTPACASRMPTLWSSAIFCIMSACGHGGATHSRHVNHGLVCYR
jgi:hypothetical protein